MIIATKILTPTYINVLEVERDTANQLMTKIYVNIP